MRVQEQLDFLWDVIMESRYNVKESPLFTGKFVQHVLAISDRVKEIENIDLPYNQDQLHSCLEVLIDSAFSNPTENHTVLVLMLMFYLRRHYIRSDDDRRRQIKKYCLTKFHSYNLSFEPMYLKTDVHKYSKWMILPCIGLLFFVRYSIQQFCKT